jgi:hypothetical protein
MLTGLRDTLADLFERFDSRHPLGTSARVDLERRGFDLTEPENTHRTDLLAALRVFVESALKGKNPSPRSPDGLDWMHRALRPAGSGARIDDLDRACDENALRTMREARRRSTSTSSRSGRGSRSSSAVFIAGFAPWSIDANVPVGLPIALAFAFSVIFFGGGWPSPGASARPATAPKTSSSQSCSSWLSGLARCACSPPPPTPGTTSC